MNFLRAIAVLGYLTELKSGLGLANNMGHYCLFFSQNNIFS